MLTAVTDLDIKLLNIFRVVAEEQGFSAAAERLNTSLPNISANMSQLESRLEMRLCERGVKGFRLTEHGIRVLSASEELYGAITAFRQQINIASSSVQREVRIGILTELVIEGRIRLPDLLAHLEAHVPGIYFNLTFETAERLKERVEKGELLFAIGYFFELPNRLQQRYLYTQTLLCYCSNEHELYAENDDSLDLESLKQHRVAGYDDFSAQEEQVAPFFRKYDSCSRTSEGILALILTGKYIGLLPDDFARHWVANNTIRAINREELFLPVDIEVVYKTSRCEDMVIRVLLEGISKVHPVSTPQKTNGTN